jgi:hypothetical protein
MVKHALAAKNAAASTPYNPPPIPSRPDLDAVRVAAGVNSQKARMNSGVITFRNRRSARAGAGVDDRFEILIDREG